MRLFVAIDWKEKQDELKTLQQPFTLVKARLVKDFHLTLKFIGEVNQLDYRWIDAQLRLIEHESFSLMPAALGVFKSYSQQVIWCGVKESLALNSLQKKVEEVLSERFTASGGFRPHLTLARIKHPHKLGAKDKKLVDESLNIEVDGSEFPVKNFLLIKSQLTPKGPEYTVLKSYPLL